MTNDRKSRLREIENRLRQLSGQPAVVKRKRMKCSDCGRGFLMDPRRWTCRCPECLEVFERQKNTERCRNYRLRQRAYKAATELGGAPFTVDGKIHLRCQHCGKVFLTLRTSRKYCSAKCRQAAYRERKTK